MIGIASLAASPRFCSSRSNGCGSRFLGGGIGRTLPGRTSTSRGCLPPRPPVPPSPPPRPPSPVVLGGRSSVPLSCRRWFARRWCGAPCRSGTWGATRWTGCRCLGAWCGFVRRPCCLVCSGRRLVRSSCLFCGRCRSLFWVRASVFWFRLSSLGPFFHGTLNTPTLRLTKGTRAVVVPPVTSGGHSRCYFVHF